MWFTTSKYTFLNVCVCIIEDNLNLITGNYEDILNDNYIYYIKNIAYNKHI